MDEQSQNDVPQELQENKQAKDLANQAAEDALPKLSKGEAFLAGIGYISFLCVLPLVIMRESKFAQFHGKQALVLAIFLYFFDILQLFPSRLAALYMTLRIILVIYCLVRTVRGETFRLPFICDLSERFNININDEQNPKS